MIFWSIRRATCQETEVLFDSESTTGTLWFENKARISAEFDLLRTSSHKLGSMMIWPFRRSPMQMVMIFMESIGKQPSRDQVPSVRDFRKSFLVE